MKQQQRLFDVKAFLAKNQLLIQGPANTTNIRKNFALCTHEFRTFFGKKTSIQVKIQIQLNIFSSIKIHPNILMTYKKRRLLLSIQLLKISFEICVDGFSKFFLLSLPFIKRTQRVCFQPALRQSQQRPLQFGETDLQL